jgi:3-oxoacyl-(acyl-carrier-protein) synthase
MAAGLIDRLFLAHPRSAGQGYFGHLRFAWSFAATMAVGTLAALVHGLLPFVCQTAAGDRVRTLYARLSGREPGKAH